MAPIIATLIANGLPLLAQAVMSAGQKVVEDKLGVKLPDVTAGPMKPEQVFELRKIELEQQQKLLELALAERRIEAETDQVNAQEITKRWQADTGTDSWLAKNIRPLTLAFLVVSLTSFAAGSGFGYEVANAYIETYRELLGIVFVAYFGSRGIEKVASIIAPALKKGG